MRTILVTGACGFIGWKVCEKLLERGDSVIAVDDLNDAYDVRLKEWRLARLRPRPGFAFTRLDISDREAVRSFGRSTAAKGRVDAVVNLAARAGVRASVADPWAYVAANVTGNLNLLELCRESGIGRFVLASTSSLYGQHNPRPYREDADTDRPLSPYAASKKAAEAMSHSYHALHGLDVTVLRFFTVYGPAGRPDMSLFRFVQWISEGREVTVSSATAASSGTSPTSTTSPRESWPRSPRARATKSSTSARTRPVVLNDAIRLIEDLVGRKASVRHEPRHPADVDVTWADISRARSLLGWQPETDFTTGVGESSWSGIAATATGPGTSRPEGRPAAVPGIVPSRSAPVGATRGRPRQFRSIVLETQGRIVFAQRVPAGTLDPPAHPGEVTESGLRCTTGNRVYPKRVPGVRIPSSPPPNLLTSRIFEAGTSACGPSRGDGVFGTGRAMKSDHRNVLVLGTCQMLSGTGRGLFMVTSPAVALLIAPHPALVTLPTGLIVVGAALAAMPTSLFTRRFGRKIGFLCGTVLAAASGVSCTGAVLFGNFWLLLLGGFLYGLFSSFSQLYRFAVADAASKEFRPKAISFVLAGGVFAGFAGPNLANWGKGLLAGHPFCRRVPVHGGNRAAGGPGADVPQHPEPDPGAIGRRAAAAARKSSSSRCSSSPRSPRRSLRA